MEVAAGTSWVVVVAAAAAYEAAEREESGEQVVFRLSTVHHA